MGRVDDIKGQSLVALCPSLAGLRRYIPSLSIMQLMGNFQILVL